MRHDRLNSVAAPLAVTAMLHGAFVLLRLAANDYDPSVFITAGDQVSDRRLLPPNVRLQANSMGYDGQYYYRIALNPATSSDYEYGIKLDSPVHRHERIFYPALVWLLSFGDASRVPWTMVAVNYAALCWLSIAGAMYARQVGRHAMWGAAFAFYPGLLLSLARDLTEILSTTFAVEALLAIRAGYRWRAGALLTCAILTRETCAVLVLAVLYGHIQSRRETASGWPFFCIPSLLVCGLWQIVVRWWWSSTRHLTGTHAVTPPFRGFLRALLASITSTDGALTYAELVYVGLWGVFGAMALKSTRAPLWERTAFVIYLALSACLANRLWEDDWGFLRLYCDVYVLGLIIMLQATGRWLAVGTGLTVALWLYLFCTRF